MDGNFGLVRKRHSGKSLEDPRNCSDLFIPDAEVDAFIDGVNDNPSQSQVSWQALQDDLINFYGVPHFRNAVTSKLAAFFEGRKPMQA